MKDTKVNLICISMAIIGILLILLSATEPDGKLIFMLIVGLAIACAVAIRRKEVNNGRREREIINRHFKQELEELRKEGIDT